MTLAKLHGTSDIVPELLDFIEQGTDFIVAGHEEPDGDCVGSQLALVSLLQRLGKNAVPCSSGPFKRPEILPYEKSFLPCPAVQEGMRVIVVDCSVRERVGDLPIDGLPVAVIDHHSTENPWGEVIFLDPSASSVTCLIEKLFCALNMEPSAEEAQLLLFGLCTDTGFFRHLDEHGAEAFNTAARLINRGASPKKIFSAIYGEKSLNSRLLMGTVLSKTRPYYGGKLLISDETLEETEHFCREKRDSDMIYQLLQSVREVEAIVLIRQENNEECSMGLRSRDRIDVAIIARQFNGGGHKNAAGAKASGSISELEEKLVAAFGPWF